ncbi:plasmid replication, integration and excision activator [Sinosporangium siamense]|uniref:plasmid replication, integration and excision activator n=1 Tax=Sinosporangium siamense TaxID=1367973 RepID=UPI001EF3D458|nr:plasmid replication, integration and excision activator [Sinosporangium siamense]
MSHLAIFPYGCYVVGPVVPVADFEASTKEKSVQTRDKLSGLPVWAVPVVDADPAAKTASKAIAVKIASAVEPVIPAPPEQWAALGLPFVPVEFEGLTVTPYVAQQTGRLAYSVRATGMRTPPNPAGRGVARMKDAG